MLNKVIDTAIFVLLTILEGIAWIMGLLSECTLGSVVFVTLVSVLYFIAAVGFFSENG